MNKAEKMIQQLLAGERFRIEVQDEFSLEVYISEELGPQACFCAAGSWITVSLKSIEQAAYLFLGFEGIGHITDVD